MRAVRKAKGRPAQAGGSVDAQKAKIYAWEESKEGSSLNTLSLDGCRLLIYNACDAFKVQLPEVTVHYTPTYSFWDKLPGDSGYVISLQGLSLSRGLRGGGMNELTCLHEVAHHVHALAFGGRGTDHGYRFASIYRDILGLWSHWVDSEWREFGIRWRP